MCQKCDLPSSPSQRECSQREYSSTTPWDRHIHTSQSLFTFSYLRIVILAIALLLGLLLHLPEPTVREDLPTHTFHASP